jgi:hypothetical protein
VYIHCKQGFIEADRYDGEPLPPGTPPGVVKRLNGAQRRAKAFDAGVEVIVVRARVRETLTKLLALAQLDTAWVVASPPTWDYEFRCFLTAVEFREVLHAIARDLDYRNFKMQCGERRPYGEREENQHNLAHAIWHAAHSCLAPTFASPADAGFYSEPYDPQTHKPVKSGKRKEKTK